MDDVLNENLNEEDVLSDDSIFEDGIKTSLVEDDDDDGVDFETFDDSASDW
jgi:hypothetical protein